MSRNGSGTYSLPTNSWSPATNGTPATAADWTALINDVATAITQSISRDGQTTITGTLQMGNNKLSNLLAGSAVGDSAAWQQLFSQGQPAGLASSSVTDIGAQNTTILNITGTTTITSFGVNYNGPRFLRFESALTLTHSATLELPNGVNITTVGGDAAIVIPIGVPASGWKVIAFVGASGSFVNLSCTGTLSANNISYSGALTGGTGVVNIGSNQIYKSAAGNVSLGTQENYGGKFAVCSATNRYMAFGDGGTTLKGIIGSSSSAGQILFGDAVDDFIVRGLNNIKFGIGGNQVGVFDSTGNYALGGTGAGYTTAGRTVSYINGTTSSLLGFGIGGSNAGYLGSSASAIELAAEGSRTLDTVVNGSVRTRIATDGNFLVGNLAQVYAAKLAISSNTNRYMAFGDASGTTKGVIGSVSSSSQILFGDAADDFVIRGLNNIKFGIGAVQQAEINSTGVFSFNSGYGSSAPAYGCRAWVNFNGTGTVAIRSAGNVSSITDNGTGDYTVNFSTALVDTNYSVVAHGSRGGVTLGCLFPFTIAGGTTRQAPTTSNFRIACQNFAGGAFDADDVMVTVFR
jgi:hypothetical protein